MSKPEKNCLLLPTPVYTTYFMYKTYFRIYNLLEPIHTVYWRKQPNPVYKPTLAYQLLERLAPSSPYNCPAYTMLALHSNKKVSGCYPIIYIYTCFQYINIGYTLSVQLPDLEVSIDLPLYLLSTHPSTFVFTL